MRDNLCVLKNRKPETLDVSGVAELMKVCPMTIYRYLKMKDPLPSYKARGKLLFFKDEVLQWIRNK